MSKRMPAIIIVVSILLLTVLVACAQPAPTPAPKPSPAPTTAPTAAPVPKPSPSPTPSPTPAKPITLKWVSYAPVNDSRDKHEVEVIKWLDERSNGRIKVTYYPGGQLFAEGELWDAAVNGLTDVAYSRVTLHAGKEPVFGAIVAPHHISWNNIEKILWGEGKVQDEVFTPALMRHNLRPMWAVPTGLQELYFKKPVKTLEDMKGLRLRSGSTGTDEWLKLLGAVPSRIASSEVYVAVQRGVIDGANHSLVSYVAYKTWEVAPYWVDTGYGTGWSYVFINENVYKSFPPDLRAIWDKTMLDAQKEWLRKIQVEEQVLIDTVKKQPGADYYVLPDAERARWAQVTMPFWDNWLKANDRPDTRKFVEVIKKFSN